MKHKIIIIIMFVTCNLQFTTKCFSQNWEWSSVIQSSDYFQPVAFSIDKNKNSYIGSHFRNMIVPVNLPSNGYDDAFLAKYDASGTLVWIKNFGSYNPYPTFPQNPTAYSEAVNVLHVDTTNNYLYASGSFYNTTQFGSFTLTSFTPNTNSYFILKMDFDGNILWAKRTNGYISGMVTDAIGNLFFCGFSYDDTVILDSTATFAPCGFVAKINPDGNFLWGKNIFKKTSDSFEFIPRGIKAFNSGIIINGYTDNDTITIDTIVRYVPENTKWSALTCLDFNGNAKWLSLYGGNTSISGYGFSIDSNGNFYTTGIFTGTGYFEDDTLIAATSLQNMYLAKHDSMGHFLWAKHANTSNSNGICVSNVVDSTLYVTGWFKGTAYFNDSITAGTVQDMFVAKYNTNGVCFGANNFGKASGVKVVQDNDNAAYCSGLSYSDITIGANSYTLYGNTDIFLAKLTGTTGIGEKNMLLPMGSLLTIYANPNTGKCDITIPEEFRNEKNLILKIYDLQGKEIQQAKIEMFENKIKLNIEAEAKGVYNVILTNGKKNYSGKIIFE